MVWRSVVNGVETEFVLYGLNNQNFIMKDKATGSWWQQITGEAILGARKGDQLDFINHDQITFTQFKREHPEGRVLKLHVEADGTEKIAPPDWDERIMGAPDISDAPQSERTQRRSVIVGITRGDKARAYHRKDLRQTGPISDQLGDTPLILMMAEDNRSIRAFDRRIDGTELQIYQQEAEPGATQPRRWFDEEGNIWDFRGEAIEGPRLGQRLTPIPVTIEFWFDWHNYNPESDVYGGM